MPTYQYRVPGATEKKFMYDVTAMLLPDISKWQIPDNIIEFDYSWVPHPYEPAFIWQFGTQWQKNGGPIYIVAGAKTIKHIDVQRAIIDNSTNKQWRPLQANIDFDYALDLINNTAGTVTINYSQSIGSFEIRFRTDDVIKNPAIPNTMNLVNINGNTVTLNYTRGTLGTVKINGSASANIELFDGGWSNLLLRQNNTNLDLFVNRSKYGKIVASVSASATGSFGLSGSITFGGTSTGASRLQGQLQEVRLWSGSLSLSAFENHTKAPAAYNGTTDAYQELIFRLPLTQKINHNTTSSLRGVEPKQSTISASFSGWSIAEPYDSIEETYYYDSLSIGAGTFDDNKIRIESSSLVGNLDIKTRAERSQYDTAPLDSKKLGIYFSPQTMIDEDIIAQLGFTELDSYIGDPGDTDEKSYTLLKWKSREYWKKYSGRNDINSYIRIFTLFDLSFFKQLDQLLPARVDKLTGLLIQPNLLERSKDSLLPSISKINETYTSSLQYVPVTTGESIIYTGNIADDLYTITGYDDDQLAMYIETLGNSKYDGFNYSYTYLNRSGSTYITASAPYWQSEFTCPSITGSVISKQFKKIETYYSGGISYTREIQSDVSNYRPTRVLRQRYDGAKMNSADFNIKSTDTYDGGPVAEIILTNPNQLIYDGGPSKGKFTIGGSTQILGSTTEA